MVILLFRGFATGLVLQLAVGPIFFYVVSISLQQTITDALIAVAAVTLVDYLYVLFAVYGVAKFLEKEKIKNIFGNVSAVIVIIFGVYMLGVTFVNQSSVSLIAKVNPGTIFISAFILTASNPLTILFWISLFAARSIQYNDSRNELLLFGVAAGFSTIFFLGFTVLIISVIKSAIPSYAIKISNIVAALIVIFYGLVQWIRGFGKS